MTTTPIRTYGRAAWLALALFARPCLGDAGLAGTSSADIDLPGYSGLASLGEHRYVVVHDTKRDDPAPRLGLLYVNKGHAPRYEPVTVEGWPEGAGPANDLESVCVLPGAAPEVLLAESTSTKDRRGRIFHMALAGNQARVLRVYALPKPEGAAEPDNFEGMACVQRVPGRIVVILGGWGGAQTNPGGVVRWGELDTVQGVLKWSNAVMRFRAPGVWPHPEERHDLSALYLDGRGKLWAAATSDGGDEGPFNSVIYQLGEVDPTAEPPLRLQHTLEVTWSEDGLKIEGLAGPPASVPSSFMSFATEDEHLGGMWRPVFFPNRLR